MYEVIKYKIEYEKKVREHLRKICVEEYGFFEWLDYIEETDFNDFFINDGNFWLAINENNEVIGTIGLKKINENIAEVKNLYLRKEYRGTGISSELMDRLIEYAYKKEYKMLQLETYKKFDRAHIFYKKYGFEVVEIIEEKYIYQKKLGK